MTIYAIGDVHGQLALLRAAHDRIADDKAREGTRSAEVVHIGDYVDRGPDSKGVIEYLATTDADEPFVFLCGNHDRMMLGFLDPTIELDRISKRIDWFNSNIGGRITLKSYGLSTGWPRGRSAIQERAIEEVPEHHLEFIRSLRMSFQTSGLYFAHAGVRPGIDLADQSEEDLLWIRDDFLLDSTDHGKLVVHGHTPTNLIDYRTNRLNIDTGAAWEGNLSAVAIEGRNVYELTKAGRVEVPVFSS